jgi:hypothetical protein
MDVTISATVEKLYLDVEEAMEAASDEKKFVKLSIYETFEIDSDDIGDVDSSDVIDLYNGLGDADQKAVREALQITSTEDLEFVPTNLEDRQKFEAFLEHRERFSLEKFMAMMGMKEPVERPDNTEHVMFCPYCSEMLDADDLGL